MLAVFGILLRMSQYYAFLTCNHFCRLDRSDMLSKQADSTWNRPDPCSLDREAGALLQAGYHKQAERLAWLAAELRAEARP